MSKLKAQFGTADDANFKKCTWSFKMPSDYNVSAGNFAILPQDTYQELIKSIERLCLCVRVHPDYQKGSEFEDMVSSVEKATNEL